MSGFLLDTNIISELIKPKPEGKLTEWVESADEDLLYLSVLTIGEIRKGIVTMEQGKRRAALQSWLETDLKRFPAAFSDRRSHGRPRWEALYRRGGSAGIPGRL